MVLKIHWKILAIARYRMLFGIVAIVMFLGLAVAQDPRVSEGTRLLLLLLGVLNGIIGVFRTISRNQK
jgi:hypothetical protein